jgi:hypothetical protein
MGTNQTEENYDKKLKGYTWIDDPIGNHIWSETRA